MGYVFTPEDFRNGRIPTEKTYKLANNLIKENLKDLCEREVIAGANIHGSNLHSDGGVGSDIDVLVITRTDEACKELRKVHSLVKNETAVPVEFVPVPIDLAASGNHTVGLFYFNYLKSHCQEGVVGKSPVEIISPGPFWNNPFYDVRTRLISNVAGLHKKRINRPESFGEEHCNFLEDLIRQPIYSAIDLLRLKFGEFPHKDGKILSKRACCDIYAEVFPDGDLDGLNKVLEARERYKAFFNGKKNTERNYIILLQSIGELLPVAVNVIKTNINLLSRLEEA